jgi:hypothetical protein
MKMLSKPHVLRLWVRGKPEECESTSAAGECAFPVSWTLQHPRSSSISVGTLLIVMPRNAELLRPARSRDAFWAYLSLFRYLGKTGTPSSFDYRSLSAVQPITFAPIAGLSLRSAG